MAPVSDTLSAALAAVPRGLTAPSRQRARLEALAGAGWGWEDIVAASQDWPWPPVSEWAAKDVVFGRGEGS